MQLCIKFGKELKQILFKTTPRLTTDEEEGMKVTGAGLNVKPNKIKQKFSS